MAKDAQFHEGMWLKTQVASTGMTQVKFAVHAKVSRQSLQTWFKQERLDIRGDMLGRLVTGLGYASIDFFQQRLAADRKLGTAGFIQQQKRWNEQITAARRLGPRASIADQIAAGLPVGESDDFDNNIEPYSEILLPEIPLFDLSVAAGAWTDVSEVAEVSDERAKAMGVFRIRVRGDSMQSAYEDGCVVEFRVIRQGRDIIEVGKDYYVQKLDQATFKRVVAVRGDEVILQAVNRRKYPKEMTVYMDDIVRAARATAKVTLL